MNLAVKKLFPDEWSQISETAHLVGFKEKRPAQMDRVDYALVAEGPEHQIIGWLTARELDSESVYWQFGAGMPNVQSSTKAVEAYGMMVEHALSQYKRITTYVENTNVRYLKLAMHFGFRIIGVRLFDGQVFVELLNKK